MTPLLSTNLTCVICNNPFTVPHRKELIRTTSLIAGNDRSEKLTESKVYFILKGSGRLWYAAQKKINLREGSFVLLPIGTRCSIQAINDIDILELIVDEAITSTDLENCLQKASIKKVGKGSPFPLEMNEKLWMFITNTVEFMKDGLGCKCYQTMKVKELLHVLRVYYPHEHLLRFFMPLNSKTAQFAMVVYENWDKVPSLNELAELSALSLSGFSKKFKRIFDTSAYQWIMDKKGEKVVEELYNGNKSIKQLTEEYGFYSVQHFGYYCKQRFGTSPAKIRHSGKALKR